MADRTLTINHADGGSETYTINRDKFAGVREMSRGHVYPMVWESRSQNNLDFEVIDDSTFNLTAADTTSTDWITFLSHYNPIRTGKHRLEFDLTLNSGLIDVGFVWNYTDRDEDPNDGNTPYSLSKRPVVGHNSWDFEIFNDGVSPYPHVFFQINSGSIFDIAVTNFKITHEPSTVTADHTATPKAQSKQTTFGGSKSITVNRDIEPLLSKVVGGAAAAYSLRDLNDSQGNNNVVRVRRESDNSEKDFIAKEVSNGAMARWVNEQPTLPLDLRELDTNTGERDGALIEAAAAYSLRKLKEDFTGDVVEVRRSSDDAVQSFTASEVADGTLENWVGASNDGFVRTWYDQSGSDNHAVQTDTAKQPKIVDGGSLLKLNGKPSIDFSTVDGYLELSQEVDTSNKPCSIIAATEPTNKTLIGQTSNRRLIFNSSDARFGLSVSAITEDYPSVSGGAVFTAIHNGTTTAPNLVIYANGSASTTNDSNQGSPMNAGVIDLIGANLGSSVTSYFDKKLPEVIIYNTDQSDNRTAIEANIGETYGITAIPAADDTVNGYVQTWYDQSGNGYDAREPAKNYQPLIVENGSIVTADGKVAIKGTGARLRLGHFPWDGESPREMLSADGTHSLFIVCDLPDQTTGNANYNYISRFHSTSTPSANKRPRVFLRKTTGELALAVEADASKVKVSSSDNQSAQLVTDIVNPSGTTKAEKHSVYIDGAFNAEQPYGTTWIPDGNTTLSKDSRLFSRGETTVDTYISELIYYPSDQSANRPAIEANINNQYDIY